MTKQEFLQRLEAHLRTLDDAERADILSDFEEHFEGGAESGKTEAEICAELGDPYACAQAYLHQNAGSPPAGQADAVQRPASPAPAPQPGRVIPAPVLAEKPAEKPGKWARTLWAVFFFALVLLSLAAFPTFAVLMLSPFIVLLVAVFAVAAFPSGLMAAFLASLCIFLFTAGLQGFIELTWLLKYAYKRAGF